MTSLADSLKVEAMDKTAADSTAAATNFAAGIQKAELALEYAVGISNSSNRLRMGTGVPAAGLGTDGDYYLRTDGASGSSIYHKESGSWAVMA